MASRRPTTPAHKQAARARREDKLRGLHDQLADAVLELRSSPAWTAWLDTAARFPRYSLNNQLLIGGQRPGATLVCGYQAWKAMGRQVRKGEKGISILAPITRTVPAQHTPSTRDPGPGTVEDPGATTVVAGFTPVPVFDVSQTDGAPLPAPPAPQLVDGHAPAGLWEALAGQVAAAGFTVARADTAAVLGGANGVTDFTTRTVTVRADTSAAQAVKTLAHELGHVLLHAPADGARPACRGIVEVEAESVAYLVTTSHGMDTAGYSFAYIAGWADAAPDPGAALRSTAERVRAAATSILDAVDPDPDLPPELADRAQRRSGLLEAATAIDARADRLAAGTDPTVEALRAAVQDAQVWFVAQAGASPGWADAVRARGIDPSAAARFGIGWAPAGWTGLLDHLRAAGHCDAVIQAAGLARPARTGRLIDALRSRITFPYTDTGGQVLGFTARAAGAVREGTPKYLNSPASALFSKREQLYGLHARTPATEALVLVEGPWDAAAVTYATNARQVGVAANGTALTAAHAQQLAATGLPVTVWTDPDQAGQTAARTAHDTLTAAGVPTPRHAQVALVDPSDFQRLFGPAAVVDALADTDPLALTVITHQIAAVQGKGLHAQVDAVRRLGPVTAGLPDADRNTIIGRIAYDTGLAPASVAAALTEGHHPPGKPAGAATTAPPTPRTRQQQASAAASARV